jgi:hypothetical protein
MPDLPVPARAGQKCATRYLGSCSSGMVTHRADPAIWILAVKQNHGGFGGFNRSSAGIGNFRSRSRRTRRNLHQQLEMVRHEAIRLHAHAMQRLVATPSLQPPARTCGDSIEKPRDIVFRVSIGSRGFPWESGGKSGDFHGMVGISHGKSS